MLRYAGDIKGRLWHFLKIATISLNLHVDSESRREYCISFGFDIWCWCNKQYPSFSRKDNSECMSSCVSVRSCCNVVVPLINYTQLIECWPVYAPSPDSFLWVASVAHERGKVVSKSHFVKNLLFHGSRKIQTASVHSRATVKLT